MFLWGNDFGDQVLDRLVIGGLVIGAAVLVCVVVFFEVFS